MSALAGRRVVLGVCGGIAAYKAIDVCRRLVDAGAHVVPVLTKGALHFVGETTFSALASEPVQAGMPNPVDDAPADALTIDDYLIERPSQTVLVRVKGDSMIDAGILEGDLVVVEKSATARRGDVVIAIVDNQFTLKRLDLDRGRFVLKPENKAYPVIRPEGTLEIFGVMVGLVRKL